MQPHDPAAGALAAAAESVAAADAAAASVPAEATILDLPEDVNAILFSQLPSARDLAACLATCRAWRTSAATPELWEAAARRRWRHGWDAPWGGAADAAPAVAALLELQRQGRWQQAYAARRQADAAAVALLGRLAWPDRREAARQEAHAGLPFPLVRDCLHRLVLAAEQLRDPPAAATAASSSSSGSGGGGDDAAAGGDWADAAAAVAAAPCSSAYWARWLYEDLQLRHTAQQVRRHAYWARAAEQELEQRAAGAAAAAASAAAAAAVGLAASVAQQGAGSGAGPAAQQQQQQQQQQPGDPAHLSDEELRSRLAMVVEEGALALAAVHRPFAELGWVRRALDSLGEELRQRMAAGGAGGGLPALRLLNDLLFGQGPPPRSPHFSSLRPPSPWGLEIRGNRERYYDPENSMLDVVLSSREGIPISIAVLHAAVAARAGLPVRLLNVPMHVVAAMDDPEPGNPARRWFVDVFDGGRVMDSQEFEGFLQGLGLVAPPSELQAMPPHQTWLRMCRNLLHIQREAGEQRALRATSLLMAAVADEGSAEAMRASVEAANACMALQEYGEAAALLRQLVGSPFQLAMGAGLHAHPLQSMLQEIQQQAGAHVEEQMRVRRREGAAAAVRYRVGAVLRHRRYHYRGVVVGWDATCAASAEWQAQMGVARLARGAAQPFYHVLPDPADRPGQAQTYVAEENVELQPLPALHRHKPGYCLHPEAGRYFSALAPGGGRYLPTPWLAACFPDDSDDL